MKRKVLLLLSITFISFFSNSQEDSIKSFFSAVYVTDIERSIEWYSKVLDLKLRNRFDSKERGFKQVNLVNDNILIELVEIDKTIIKDTVLARYPGRTVMAGFYKTGFRVGNIDTFHKKLEGLKVNFYGNIVNDPVDQKQTFLVKDPDNNILQFFE
jgi:catechol 2,3-dioxygenase-like lactoylglutathione lyase family enzyme